MHDLNADLLWPNKMPARFPYRFFMNYTAFVLRKLERFVNEMSQNGW